MGGEEASLRGMLDGLLFEDVWLLVSQHPEGTVPAQTQGRAIDHIGFIVENLDSEASEFRQHGVRFQEEPLVPENGRTSAKRAFVMGPDNVRIAVVETAYTPFVFLFSLLLLGERIGLREGVGVVVIVSALVFSSLIG